MSGTAFHRILCGCSVRARAASGCAMRRRTGRHRAAMRATVDSIERGRMAHAALWPESLGRWPPPHAPLRAHLESRSLARGCLWTGRADACDAKERQESPSTVGAGGTRIVRFAAATFPSMIGLGPSIRCVSTTRQLSGLQQDLTLGRRGHGSCPGRKAMAHGYDEVSRARGGRDG